MRDTATLLLLFLTTYAAFACLALSQQRHWEAVSGGRPRLRSIVWMLRSAGVALLALSFIIAMLRDGADYGALLWGAMLSLAALGIVVTLALLNRRNAARNTAVAPNGNMPQPARANHV